MEFSISKNVATYVCVLLLCCAGIGCASQSKEPTAPCDPQPPCLPARSQPFGFSFELRDKKKAVQPSFFLMKSGNTTATILPGAAPQSFIAEFDQPQQLDWQRDNAFSVLLTLGDASPDTLLVLTSEVKVDCCPQLMLRALYRNGKKLCDECHAGDVIRF